jgi:MGT family glycosyltransferase
MESSSKVILITIPSLSHISPILPIVKNLIDNFNYKFIIYSTQNYKQQIEKTGAEFRSFHSTSALPQQQQNDNETLKIKVNLKSNQRVSRTSLYISELIDIAENNTIYLAKEIDKEKPDLILYENTALHANLTIRLLTENYNLINENTDRLKLPVIYFSTTFLHEKYVYPNDNELKLSSSFNVDELINIAIDKEFLIQRAKILYSKFGIKYIDPFDEAFIAADSKLTNLVFILPELHPRVYLYHRNNKFIGTIINQDHLSNDLTNYNYIFQPLDINFDDINRKIVVYVYLSFKFNENIGIYLKIFNIFLQNSTKFTVLISFNHQCIDKFEKMLKDYQLTLNDNFLIVTNVPKLEILKRSNIFITNCDIYNVNESLYSGVPMLCIPITDNQLLIAHRISTELGLGIFIDFTCFNNEDFLNSINNLINDYSYKNNCLEYSKLFREYDAKYNATKIICDFIDVNKKII